MTVTDVCASTRYQIKIGKDIIKTVGCEISKITSPCKAAIISDTNVFPLYGGVVRESLENSGFEVYEYVFPSGEKSKNLSTYAQILDFLAGVPLSRRDIIIALGGGVVGDMAGFCAATYLRGIKYVQIPTTILAACDSSVGGKTAVDLEHGKNLVGAFHQPSLVLCDTDTFKTLDKKQISCGFAEIIKYGMISDKKLFETLSESADTEEILSVCVKIKSDIVSRDERESGERKLLNFGHTLGHAIEMHSHFSLTHGHSVACGMMMICQISERLGLCENVTVPLGKLLKKYDLPTSCDISKADMLKYVSNDKKSDGDSITLVIPERIGKCVLKKVSFAELSEMLDTIL